MGILSKLKTSIKAGTLLAAGVTGSKMIYEHHNKELKFSQNVRLVFPSYDPDTDKQVDVLSKNQLEYIIK